MFVGGLPSGFIGGSCGSYGTGVNPTPLNPHQECNFSITSLSLANGYEPFRVTEAGAAYSLRIVLNVVFEFNVTYGGSSNQPQLANVILPEVATVAVSSSTSSQTSTQPLTPLPGNFLNMIYLMLAAVTIGVLLVGAILAFRILIRPKREEQGLYGDNTGKQHVTSDAQPPWIASTVDLKTPTPPDVPPSQTIPKPVICTYCGAKLQPGNTKCSNCGLNVRYMGSQ